jgi:serine protease Do
LLRSARAADGVAVLEAVPDRADGSDLYIVGYPAHGMVTRRPSLTPAAARPSALAATGQLLQVMADIHQGHSGSPLLDEYGAVVGVVTKVVDTPAEYAKTGKLIEGVGFAIPGEEVTQFLRAHLVPFSSATPSTSLKPADRLAQAQMFISQLSCWQ